MPKIAIRNGRIIEVPTAMETKHAVMADLSKSLKQGGSSPDEIARIRKALWESTYFGEPVLVKTAEDVISWKDVAVGCLDVRVGSVVTGTGKRQVAVASRAPRSNDAAWFAWHADEDGNIPLIGTLSLPTGDSDEVLARLLIETSVMGLLMEGHRRSMEGQGFALLARAGALVLAGSDAAEGDDIIAWRWEGIPDKDLEPLEFARGALHHVMSVIGAVED